MSERWVRFKGLRHLINNKVIHLIHVSEDGEYMRFKILPDGPEIGRWDTGDEKILVVNCQTEHENFVNTYPQLFEEVK